MADSVEQAVAEAVDSLGNTAGEQGVGQRRSFGRLFWCCADSERARPAPGRRQTSLALPARRRLTSSVLWHARLHQRVVLQDGGQPVARLQARGCCGNQRPHWTRAGRVSSSSSAAAVAGSLGLQHATRWAVSGSGWLTGCSCRCHKRHKQLGSKGKSLASSLVLLQQTLPLDGDRKEHTYCRRGKTGAGALAAAALPSGATLTGRLPGGVLDIRRQRATLAQSLGYPE